MKAYMLSNGETSRAQGPARRRVGGSGGVKSSR